MGEKSKASNPLGSETAVERKRSVDLSAIQGQPHTKGCFPWLRIESDRAEMLLDNSLHGIQPQPQSFTEGFCGKEWFEHAIRALRWNPVPGVSNLDKNRLPLQPG